MARITESFTEHQSTTTSKSHSETASKSDSQSQSTTSKVLDEALRDRILSGLMGYMTDEEIDAYAENLLAPQRDAEMEAVQQKYDTAKLTGEQELESLASELTKSIAEQKRSYARSAADVQTAALARGMGRSSYALETLANTGDRLSRAVKELTDDHAQKTAQAREQMALSAQQNAQTQGRINTDYARALAAKVQELKENRRSAYNQNYLTAVSGSMGSATSGTSSTQGSATTDTTSTSHTEGTSSTVTRTYSGR
ncbi:MAG: hypothetical protein ACI4O4_11830 [Candidatus Ventricola sp.]